MAIAKKIINYLEKEGYKYEIIEHKTTYTAWDTAQTEKIKPQEVTKSLIMKLDNDYALALLSANRNLDKKKFLKTVNVDRKKQGEKCLSPHQNSNKNISKKTLTTKNKKNNFGVRMYKKIDFAKEVWMKKNILGKVGAVSPFGKIVQLKIYADSLLFKNKKLYLGSGDYSFSIAMSASQYFKKEEIIKGSFSQSKKIKK